MPSDWSSLSTETVPSTGQTGRSGFHVLAVVPNLEGKTEFPLLGLLVCGPVGVICLGTAVINVAPTVGIETPGTGVVVDDHEGKSESIGPFQEEIPLLNFGGSLAVRIRPHARAVPVPPEEVPLLGNPTIHAASMEGAFTVEANGFLTEPVVFAACLEPLVDRTALLGRGYEIRAEQRRRDAAGEENLVQVDPAGCFEKEAEGALGLGPCAGLLDFTWFLPGVSAFFCPLRCSFFQRPR